MPGAEAPIGMLQYQATRLASVSVLTLGLDICLLQPGQREVVVCWRDGFGAEADEHCRWSYISSE